MPKPSALTREEFETIIKNYEANGQDVTELKRILAETYNPPKPVAKVLKEFEAKPKFVSPEILEIESQYSLVELKDMARNKGLKYTGTKDELCLGLIRAGILRR